jgi:lipid A disaccharide synthetase
MGELTAHTDVLLESARNLLKIYPNAKFLVPANNDINHAYINSRLKE